MKPIKFTSLPAIGTVLMIDGQRYTLTAHRPHRRQDGQMTMVLCWESHCPTCGAPFTFTSSLSIRHVNRRCEQHRAPRKPVRGDHLVIPPTHLERNVRG